jgi:hypothetical protein
MPADIREVLQNSAATTQKQPDIEAALRAGSRLRWRQRFMAASVVTLIVGAGSWIALTGVDSFTKERREGGGISQGPDGSSVPLQPTDVETVNLEAAPTLVAMSTSSAWVANSDGKGGFLVSRIDLSTETVTAEIPIEGFPVGLDFEAGHLWVAAKHLPSGSGGVVMRIDASTDTPVATNELAVEPLDIAADETGAWLTRSDGTLVRLDRDARSQGTTTPGAASLLAAEGGNVWTAATEGTLIRKQGNDTTSFRVQPNVVGLELGEGAVWVSQQLPDGGFVLTKLDATTGEVLGSTTSLGRGAGHFSVDRDFVWVTLYGESEGGSGAVVRIDSETLAIVGEPIPVGRGPVGIDSDDQVIWVANFDDATVSRIELGE